MVHSDTALAPSPTPPAISWFRHWRRFVRRSTPVAAWSVAEDGDDSPKVAYSRLGYSASDMFGKPAHVPALPPQPGI